MNKIVTLDHKDPVYRTFMLFMRISDSAKKYSDLKFYREARFSNIKYLALQSLVLNNGKLKHVHRLTT